MLSLKYWQARKNLAHEKCRVKRPFPDSRLKYRGHFG
jgi:hypothetical protein